MVDLVCDVLDAADCDGDWRDADAPDFDCREAEVRGGDDLGAAGFGATTVLVWALARVGFADRDCEPGRVIETCSGRALVVMICDGVRWRSTFGA